MSYNDANEVADELLEPRLSRYHSNLETSTEGSEYIFDSVQLMPYKCHRVNFRRGGFRRIASPDWLKKKISSSKSEK